MSNRLTIEPTIFTDQRTGAISYGYRCFDNYGQTYANTWDKIPDDDMEVLALVLEDSHQNDSHILDHLIETKSGLWISNNYYEWEQIEPVFQAADTLKKAIENYSELKIYSENFLKSIENYSKLKIYSENFLGFCKNATDTQLENILRDEYIASRDNENHLADYNASKIEAERRGWIVNRGQRIC